MNTLFDTNSLKIKRLDVKPKIKRISFQQNYNNKLFNYIFAEIVPATRKFETGDKIDIRIMERFFCYAEILDVVKISLKKYVDSNYNFLNHNLTKKEFMDLMSSLYSNKEWWNKEDTMMNMVLIKKKTQLDIFENI